MRYIVAAIMVLFIAVGSVLASERPKIIAVDSGTFAGEEECVQIKWREVRRAKTYMVRVNKVGQAGAGYKDSVPQKDRIKGFRDWKDFYVSIYWPKKRDAFAVLMCGLREDIKIRITVRAINKHGEVMSRSMRYYRTPNEW